MRRIDRFIIGYTVLLLVALTLLNHSPVGIAATTGDIAVIVHGGVRLDNLSFIELRKIMLGDKQYWPSTNERITILLRAPTCHERDAVLKQVYEMNEAKFKQYWIAKVFRAEAPSSPKVVYTNEMAISLVEKIPGSISFVDNGSPIPKSVKKLKVDNLLPGDRGYRIR